MKAGNLYELDRLPSARIVGIMRNGDLVFLIMNSNQVHLHPVDDPLGHMVSLTGKMDYREIMVCVLGWI